MVGNSRLESQKATRPMVRRYLFLLKLAQFRPRGEFGFDGECDQDMHGASIKNRLHRLRPALPKSDYAAGGRTILFARRGVM